MNYFNFSGKKTKTLANPLTALFILVLAPSVLFAPAQAQTQDFAKIVSSVPIVQSVAIPQNVCYQQYVQSPVYNSGGGAVLGALAGGVIGSQIGQGSGRAAGAVIGAIGGAAIGNSIEGNSGYSSQQIQTCQTRSVYEQKIVGYDVGYDYRGQIHYTKLNFNPNSAYMHMSDLVQASSNYAQNLSNYSGNGYSSYGQPIQTSVVPAAVYTPSTITTITNSTTYYGTQPVTVYPAYPVYPVYRNRYPSSSINITIGNQRDGAHQHRDRDRYRDGDRDRDRGHIHNQRPPSLW